jgi:TonB family protein
MRLASGIALLLMATAITAEDDDAVVARVVDSSIERIPEHTVAPKYPRKARRDRIEGEVRVCFEIDRHGRPRRVAVRNSTHRAFEKPSLKAVKASTFRALGDDEPVPQIKACRTFVFELQPVEKR